MSQSPDAHERMMEAIGSGQAVVLLGVNLEPLGKGKHPMIRECDDGTVEFRFRTAPARKAFVIDCNLYAEQGHVAVEAIWDA